MKKRLISIILALALVLTLLPISVHAAATISATVTYGGTTYSCNTIPKVNEKLEAATTSYSSPAVVEMLGDWVDSENKLVIPDSKYVTLNMNGHMISRDYSTRLGVARDEGECILVGASARLTINGGSTSVAHSGIRKYTSTNNYTTKTYYGGLITGCNTHEHAAGIEMNAYSKVYLYDVTIAGNRMVKTLTFSHGNGGAVRMNGASGDLYLYRSSIKDNYAENCGGGVYVEDYSYNWVYLYEGSTISNNVSGSYGGGIAVNGTNFRLYVDGSSVNSNQAGDDGGAVNILNRESATIILTNTSYMSYNTASGDGGAINLNSAGGTVTMTNATIYGNKANSGVGGGINLCSSDCHLTMNNGCHINSNTASSNGGGVYVSTGADCWIKTYGSSNSSINTISYNTSGGYGGGVAAQSANFLLDMRYSQINSNTASSNGGGVYVTNASSAVINMTNSWMNSNTSSAKGGGIVLDSEGAALTMDNSHINSNKANGGYGGGLALEQKSIVVTMKNASTISSNTASGMGGGVYVNADQAKLAGDGTTAISSNTASDDGGGVYFSSENNSLNNMLLQGNKSTSGKGGAVAVNNDGNGLSACTITGNSASNKGGGVWQFGTGDLSLDGLMYIKDNSVTASGAVGPNLYIDSKNLVQDTKLVISVDTRSEIHYIMADAANDFQVSRDPGTYAEFDFIYDSNSYHTKWYNDVAKDNAKYRYLYLVSGAGNGIATPTAVAANTETVVNENPVSGDVWYTTGGSSYSLKTICFTYTPMTNSVEDYNAVCYYSDGYFFENPNLYNEHLATMSAALMTAGYYTNRGTKDSKYYQYNPYLDSVSEQTYAENTYDNKHASLRQMLSDIGCADETIHVNEFSTIQPTMDSIGVGMAYKHLYSRITPTVEPTYSDTGYILMPVSIRGAGYEAEWTSNVTVGPDGEELGFAMAANMVYSEILDYIDAHDEVKEAAENGRLILWVTGYSRSGATANLVAKRIIAHSSPAITGIPHTNTDLTNQAAALAGRTDSYTNAGNKLFCYTFEAPQGGTDAAQTATGKADSAFFCIHNVLNKVDIVPYVAPTDMGFKRYGVDHYAPGTEAYSNTYGSGESRVSAQNGVSGNYLVKQTVYVTRGVSASTPVTTWRDNDYAAVGSVNYEKLRYAAVAHMKAVNPYMVFDDYFNASTIKWVQSNFPSWMPTWLGRSALNPAVDYDSTSFTPELFIEEFISRLQEWGISGRTWYSTNNLTLNNTVYHSTFQQAIRDAFEIIYSLSPDGMDAIIGDANTIMDKIGFGDIYNLYFDVLRNWNGLTEAKKQEYIEWVWNDLLVDSGVLSNFTAAQRAELKEDWPIVANPLLSILSADYNAQSDTRITNSSDRGSNYLGTLLYNVDRILNNHFAETLFGWLRASDSYYTNKSGTTYTATQTTRYAITRPSRVDVPTAQAVCATEGLSFVVDVPSDSSSYAECYGAQVLHLDIPDIGGEAIYYQLDGGTANRLYENGITITGEGDHTVTAYAMSYGVKGSVGTYRIHIGYPQEYTVDQTQAAIRYTDGWVNDTNASHFGGTAKKLTVTSSANNFDYGEYVEFTFTGEGFRLYTDTSCKSGMVMVSVSYDDNGTQKTDKKYLSLYRGYTGWTEQDGVWTPVVAEGVSAEQAYADSLYHQIPAISMDFDACRTYTVKIAPYYTSIVDKLNLGYAEFSVDSITFVNLTEHENVYSYNNLRDAVVAADSLISLDVIYFNAANVPADWSNDGAVTRAYFFDGNGHDAWSEFFPTGDGSVCAARKPGSYAWIGFILVRCNPNSVLTDYWNAKWNQTENIYFSWGEGFNYVDRIKWLNNSTGLFEVNMTVYSGSSGTVSGGLMIDGSGSIGADALALLRDNGPKNLLYLGSRQALIFTVGSDAATVPANQCGVGAKAISGHSNARLAAYTVNADNTLTALFDHTFTDFNEAYVQLTGDSDLKGATVMLYNAGTDPLALTRLRSLTPLSLSFTEPNGWRGVRLLRRMQQGELEPIGGGAATYFTAHSLSLEGDIGVNFYLDPCGQDVDTLSVALDWANGTEVVTLSELTPEANGRYKLTARVAAKEMSDRITATLRQGDTVLEYSSYSVAEYAERIIENRNGEFNTLFSEAGKLERLQALCRAMLIYGAAAQNSFAYRTDAPADQALADPSLTPLTAQEIAALDDSTVPNLSAFGLTYCGSSLLLETKTVYRLYFTVTNPEKLAGLTVLCGDTELPRGEKDGMVYYDVEDIHPKALLDPVTLRFGTVAGGSFAEVCAGSFTPASYLSRAMNAGNEALLRTVTALYRYGLAAADYFR